MESRKTHSGDSQPSTSWSGTARSSSSSRGASKPDGSKPHHHHHQQHNYPPPPPGHGYIRVYKVALDQSITGKGKDRVCRYNGKCVGDKYKHLDFNQAPSDPRSKYRRPEPPKTLPVPKLLVDDQYTGIPPKREVTISNLSDNVTKEFLTKMVINQKLDPDEVLVMYHPTTKKHLQMAHILFKRSTHARAFVETNDGHLLMGFPMTCILDPFAAHLNSMFVDVTQMECMPALPYLQGMSDHSLSLRREEIVGKKEPKEPEADAAAAPAAPPAAATPVETSEPMERSPSPMDTSCTPPEFDPLRPPPIAFIPMPPMQPALLPYGSGFPMMQPVQHMQPQHVYLADPAAAALTASSSSAKPPSPPPPYSELPPAHHGSVYDERVQRSTSRKRSLEPEGVKPKRDKRRRASTSSSSSYSSKEEGRSSSSRRHGDGGVEKKKEEYLRVKRYVSSERDPNGDKRITKEVKTMTYKRRTEKRTTIGQKASPDSFDEEMKRRERSMSRGMRSAEKRGRDEMRSAWSSPSSDSDNAGGRRKKRGKDHSSDKHKDHEKRPPPPPEPSTSSMSTPSICSSTTSTSFRQRGFDAPPPAFDPTQPPPPLVVVPPVGLVLPDCSVPPPPPPPPPTMMTGGASGMMVLPPPPLPGGFIPPPEFFGLQSTPAMMCAASAASAAAAGMTPLPPNRTPMMSGYCSTPSYSSPAKGLKDNLGFSSGISPANSSPLIGSSTTSAAGLGRVSSSSSLTMSAATTAMAAGGGGRTPIAAMATPPTSSEGGSTPATAAGTPAAEKKANIDDRLSQLFGLKKARKEEEVRETKHVVSSPSVSAISSELQQLQQKRDESEDMEVCDDDDMDVASSSSGEMTLGGGGETEEERRRREEIERRRKEDQADWMTRVTLDKLLGDLRQQITKDMMRKMEITAFNVVEEWQKKQKSVEDEKKMQLIRDSLAAAAARDASSAAATPKKDPMEEMLAAKLLSPEGLTGGISKVFSSINIVKRKNLEQTFSRDGTPLSREMSRAPSMPKSRSVSRSRSTTRSSRDSSVSSRSSSSSSSDEAESSQDEVRRRIPTKKRTNVRNIESSQESSSSASGNSDIGEEEDEDVKENRGEVEKKERKSAASSPVDDDEVDVVGMSEDEVEKIKEEIKEEEKEGSVSPTAATMAGPPPALLAAAAAAAAAHPSSTALEHQVLTRPTPQMTAVAVTAAAAAAPAAAVVAPPTAAQAAVARQLEQQDLMLHRPSMRAVDGYDPIRYDHPYVKQLGIPFYDNRSQHAAAVRRLAQQAAATTAAAGSSARTGIIYSKNAPSTSGFATAAAAAAPPAAYAPIQSTKDMLKRVEGEKVPQALLTLFPQPVPRKSAIRVEEEPVSFRPKKIYKKRTEEEELRIRDSFKAGMDQEDEKFLKMALAELQADGRKPFGSDKTVEFESRLRAYTPRELVRPTRIGRLDNYYDDEELAGIVPHSTGCARSEGFYRLTFKQKIRIMRRPEAFQDRTEINERDEVVTRHQVQAQKEQRSMNRRLQTMVDSNTNSDFFKVNQLKYRKKMIKFARSRIHGWGLYALEPIAPDDMIVEYIGQKIRPMVADEREKAYERRGIGSSYLFRIDEDEVIDATRQGNFARFINHSCQPNCYAKVVTVDGDKRIVIYSKSLIQKGDEITYDYKFPLEEEKIECLCGAPQCRGTLN